MSSLTPAECHHSSGGFSTPSNMTDFFKNLKLKLIITKRKHPKRDQPKFDERPNPKNEKLKAKNKKQNPKTKNLKKIKNKRNK